jgi:hypothetical protein
MKKEEIIAGQVYCANFNNTIQDYIYEAPGQIGFNGFMHPASRQYHSSKDVTHDWTQGYTVRLATEVERKHFKSCQATGGWVDAPKDVIINEYQIY